MKTSIDGAKALAARFLRLSGNEAGQAASEYALISSFMLLGAGLGGYWFLYKSLMDAFNSYMGSIHFVLNLALP